MVTRVSLTRVWGRSSLSFFRFLFFVFLETPIVGISGKCPAQRWGRELWGRAVYPLYYGYHLGAVDETFLNVVYNVADVVNKMAFVLSCWSAAKVETEAEVKKLPSCVAKMNN